MEKKDRETTVNSDMVILSGRIKELRKKTGFSAEQFAYENNIARAQYGRYEAGKDLKYTTLLKLIRAFELTPSEFFEGIK